MSDNNTTSLFLGEVDPSRFGNLDLLKKVAVNFDRHYSEHDSDTRKWFKDSGGTWHHVTPEGGVYRTLSDNNNTSRLLGGVDASRFDNPKLLKRVSMDFGQHYSEYDKAGQKWFKDAGGTWHHVTPEGAVYRTLSGNTSQLVGGVDPTRFSNPNLMKRVSVNFGQYYSEHDQGTRKWFKDVGGTWHHVTPEGAVYRTLSDNTSQLVGGVDPSRFGNPKFLKRVSVNFDRHYSQFDSGTQKWFKDAGGTWHHVTPEGAVYKTLSDNTFQFLGGVDPSRFDNLNLMKKVSVNFDRHYSQYDKGAEKWFKDAGGTWHHVTPEGAVYKTLSDNTSQLLGGIDISRFENPDLMKSVSVDFDRHYPEYDSATQKWFKDAGGTWHHLTQEGAVYKTLSDNTSQFLGGVSADYFSKPNNLVIDY